MPKVPGRESTRKTITVEKAAVASFLFPWDKAVFNKPCCIVGCDHNAQGRKIGETGFKEFEPCDRGNAAAIYNEALMPGPKPDPYVGIACPHHVEGILARDG